MKASKTHFAVALVFSILLTLSFTGLFQVYWNIRNAWTMQQNAAVFTVFSKTRLTSEIYTLLEQRLRALPNVRSLSVTSPQEGLEIALKQTPSDLDAQWIRQKAQGLSEKGETLLPYTFDLYLKTWDKASVGDLQQLVLKLGAENGEPWVDQIYFNAERQSAILTLQSYRQWLERFFIALFAGLIIFLGLALQSALDTDDFSFANFAKDFLRDALAGLAGGLASIAVFAGLWISVFGGSLLQSKGALAAIFAAQWVLSTVAFWAFKNLGQRRA